LRLVVRVTQPYAQRGAAMGKLFKLKEWLAAGALLASGMRCRKPISAPRDSFFKD